MQPRWDRGLWLAACEALENVWRKIQLFSVGLLHLLFSSDKRWPSSAIAGAAPFEVHASPKTTAKRIVFVRHAESEWNVVFNRGLSWLVLVRFVRAVVREWLLLPTFDSLFIDSPLSHRGVRQAKALSDHVALASSPPEEPEAPPAHWLQYLGAALPNSMVAASNLRRTIDTARIGSAARLGVPGERIHVLSCLQEIGRNIDTLAISDAYSLPPPTLASALLQGEKHSDELFNVMENHGNKAVLGCARARLVAFATWACAQKHCDVLVVYGHSHWFRAFCREFFPPHIDHPAKSEKLANCAVVTFELHERRADGRTTFSIPPERFQYIR